MPLHKIIILCSFCLLLCSCVVKPTVTSAYDKKCQIVKKKVELSVEQVQFFEQLNCSGKDELAIASGLNLRTIQRIEKEASASLQSRKSLASALDIDTLDLEYQESKKMKQYEYKTLEIENKEGFLSGIKKQQLPDLAELFNKEGMNGWLVVQILTPESAQGAWSAKTGKNGSPVAKRDCC
ncbi:DUF4177 domain-containing protein [Thalassotalea sp. ND16A]|uniref:DUF4177 domain-containing protein n=1 Tax=Thalassotalea sp. ND16A TaxID=1535422 RepID=UPI00051CCC80|nr:DUF4177 domain-containing protein [Thalassotalea sp. ND16A]KGK00152.1 hypothetical protein ND16A_0343 [Thalassotalea sp. ND16A]